MRLIVKWAEDHNENPDGDDCIMIILELPSAQPDVPDINVGDMISREELFEELNCINLPVGNETVDKIFSVIENIPSAQPDGIPLEWIDKHLEWLDNCDNDFAQLAKVGIRAMVEIWKKDKT